MNLPTASGVKLSDEEFHGIMAAVARRINRTAHFGHPAAVVDAAPQGDWSQLFQPEGGANGARQDGAPGPEAVLGG